MSLLKSRDYRIWLLADTTNTLGSAVRVFCFPILALSLTGSALSAGLMSMVTLICQGIGQVPGGAIVDRFNRRVLLVVSGVSGLAIYLVMFALLGAGLLNTGALVVISGIMGLRVGLLGSVTDVCLKAIVPADSLSSAFALNAGRDSALGITAAPIGGLLFGIGRFVPFLVDALSYLSLVWAALLVKCKLEVLPETTMRKGLLYDIAEGWRWVWSQSTVRALILVACLLMFGVNGVLLTNILAWTSRGTPPVVLGLLETCMAVGTLLGSALAPLVAQRYRGIHVILFGTTLIGLLLIFSGVVGSLPVTFLCYGIGFIALPIVNSVAGGYLMVVVPSDYLGRVWSVSGTLTMALGAAGAMLVGVFVEAGMATSAIVAFGVVAVCSGVTAGLSRGVRDMPRAGNWGQP